MSDNFLLSNPLPSPSHRPQVFLRVYPSPSPSGLPTKLILRNGGIASKETCCCNCGCFLPYSTTATFSGLVDKTHSHHCDISITSTFGGGARAVGMLPGGKDPEDRGPLTSVLLVDGGNGYAIQGRSPPTIHIKGSGKDAVFTPVLKIDDSSGCPIWSIDSISVDGGSKYTNDEILKITTDKHDTTIVGAIAQLKTKIVHVKPNITASLGGGNGAQFAVSSQQDNNNPPNWYITNVAVNNGGTGYFPRYPVFWETRPLSFSTNGGTTVSDADVKAYPAVKLPEDLLKDSTGGGFGADIDFNFEQISEWYWDGDWREAICWHVTSATLNNGGSNYAVGDYYYIRISGDDTTGGYNEADLAITEVDENGSILSFELVWDGRFRESIDGSIAGTYVVSGGSYFLDAGNGEPLEVIMLNKGQYYRNNPDMQPCVAKITVTPCGGGYGAEIEAIVDEDVHSPTFGKILSLNIVEGGYDYLVWTWCCTAYSQLNGKEFVLRAVDPRRLVFIEFKSCFGTEAAALIDNRGPRLVPVLKVNAPCNDAYLVPSLSEHQSEGEECRPYWSISDVSASGGTNCPDESKAYITDGDCGLIVEEAADIDLHGSNGTLIGSTINKEGKYYRSFEWDGQPSPIYSVSITNHGYGYARFARLKPDLILTVPSGGWGATFDFDLVERKTKCKLPYWIIKNITVSGGNGYTDGANITAVPNEQNVIIEKQISAQLFTRTKPTITGSIVANEGSGAEITIKLLQKMNNGHKIWVISSVSGGGGQDYSEDAHVELDYGAATQEIEAEFEVLIQKGKVTCVKVINGGSYYLDDGKPKEIRLYDSGIFYKEDKTLPPYVADVDVIITQKEQSHGNGAIIEAIVDDDTESSTFGTIKRLLLVDCGENYSYFGGPLGCDYFGGCRSHCSIGYPHITVNMPHEKNKPMIVTLDDVADCGYIDIHFKSEDIEDCNHPFTAEGSLWWGAPDGYVSIEAGGIWDSRGTDDCPTPCTPETPTAQPYAIPLVFDIPHGPESHIKPDQPISFSSNMPCLNGTIEGGGTLDNIITDIKWINTITNIEHKTDLFIDIQCGKFEYENEPSEYKYQIIIWIINPDETNSKLNIAEWSPNKSEYTNKISVGDDGYLHGTVTIKGRDGYEFIVNLGNNE